MKFNLPEEKEKFLVKKNLNRKTISDLYDLENFPSFRFGSVGVFITSKRNVPFKLLSSVINNGKKPVSWTLKVYYSKDGWNIQIGIHPNANTKVSLYSILEKYKEKFPETEIIGHNNVASILKLNSKNSVEKVVRSIINVFRGVELEISDFEIIEAFTLIESNSFIIPSNYSKNVDKSAYSKFNEAANKIQEYALEEEESRIIEKIKIRLQNEKYISEKGKKYLTDLMKKYLTEHERISIAMKSLYKK
jgi:uncharacterized protein YqgV (UPF0045/DUF77 family)